MSDYIINEWALVRRNEMVDIPDKLDIHPDFLIELDKDEFEAAFRYVWGMFYQILTVLELVAKKVLKTQQIGGWSHFGNSFLSWNYRILKDDINTSNVGYEADYIADRMHNNKDMEFVFEFHRVMKECGYCYERGGWNDGPDICYYNKRTVMENKGPYLFRLMSWKADLQLFLRIRNAEKCLSYIEDCTDDIKKMFRHSAPGCHNHTNGTCRNGVGYIYDGEERWHCGCCSAAFKLHPSIEDIPRYLKLVELGVKR